MKYFLVTFLIVSIATHAAFAHRDGHDHKHNTQYQVNKNSRSALRKAALCKKNQDIVNAGVTVEEIEAQIEKQIHRAKKVQSFASGAGMYSFLFSAGGLFVSKMMKLDGLDKASRLVRLFSLAGGTVIPGASYMIYQAKKDQIEKLSVLLTLEKDKLREEYSKINELVECGD